MSESDVCRRQILTTKVGPRAVRDKTYDPWINNTLSRKVVSTPFLREPLRCFVFHCSQCSLCWSMSVRSGVDNASSYKSQHIVSGSDRDLWCVTRHVSQGDRWWVLDKQDLSSTDPYVVYMTIAVLTLWYDMIISNLPGINTIDEPDNTTKLHSWNGIIIVS